MQPTAKSLASAEKLMVELISAASAQGVVTPMQVSQLFTEQRRIREGLVEALKPGGAVASVMTAEFCRQMPEIGAVPAYTAINQMLFRRAREEGEWHRILTYDQQFRGQVSARLHSLEPLTLPSAASSLTPNDSAKLVESLLQSKREGGAEPVIHILLSADGQRRGHDALAACWQPGGSVHQCLLSVMKNLLPDVPAKSVEGAVARFIATRHDRAVVIAEAMEVQSPVVQTAIAQSLAIDAPSPSQVVVNNLASQMAHVAEKPLAV